jgi:opacity protein-like surface antigen
MAAGRHHAALVAAALALCASPVAGVKSAHAADFPDTAWLRGSVPVGYARWDGLILGVEAGKSTMRADFGNATSSETAYILRNTAVEDEFQVSDWTALPNDTTNSTSYGGFIGYNIQMDQLVLGADIGYTRPSSLQSNVADSISRSVLTSDGYQNDVTVTASSSVKLVDFGTVRLRAGYAYGQFLPYAMVGAAVGRFNYTSSSTVTASGVDVSGGGKLPYSFGPETDSEGQDNKFAAGFVAGLGIDVAVTPNVFVRGEWEYIGFAAVGGIRTDVNTLRAGIGLRF